MDPRKFLELAIILKGGPASPECCRTSISRAYYAAFNFGVQTLASIGVRCSGGSGAHGDLMKCLGGSGDKLCEKAGARLQALHGRRIDADYEMSDLRIETRNEADLACTDANAILAALGRLMDDPAMTQSRESVRRHASSVLRLPVS